MPVENYKKWIVVGIISLLAVIVAFAVISTSPDRQKKYSGTSSAPSSGPVKDTGPQQIIPVDKLAGNTKDPKSLALLGDKYFESGNYEQAIEVYKRVLEIDPDDVDTYNDLGLAYYYTRRPGLAVDALRKGTEAMPSYQRIWLSLGFVLLSTGDNEEGKSALIKAAELGPDSTIGMEAKRMMGLIQ